MFAKRSFILIGVLLVALPVPGAELWVAPAVQSPDTEVGDWAVTAGGRTHFSFAIPNDMLALSSAKVVLIGKNNKETDADVYLSIAQNGLRHDDFTASLVIDPVICVADEIMEVDVTSIFPATLYPGEDYASIYFSTKFAGVVGMRFQYESVVADGLATETAARVAGDDALQSALDAEISARISADETEALIRQAADEILLAQISADMDTDPTNELITSLALVGSELQISEGGGSHSVELSSLSGVPFFPYIFAGTYIAQGDTEYVVPDHSAIYTSTVYETGIPGTFVGMVTHTYTYSGSQYAQPETYTLRVANSDTGLSCVGRNCAVWDPPVPVTASSSISVKVEVPLTDICVESGGNTGCAGIWPTITLYFVPEVP
jgi:hypothetical protein